MLCCDEEGVLGIVNFVLSVMRVVGGVSLWVVSVFCRVDVVCWCLFVHPVAMLSAMFCVICSLLMFVSDDIGDHLLWLCMLRVSHTFVFPMLLM